MFNKASVAKEKREDFLEYRNNKKLENVNVSVSIATVIRTTESQTIDFNVVLPLIIFMIFERVKQRM